MFLFFYMKLNNDPICSAIFSFLLHTPTVCYYFIRKICMPLSVQALRSLRILELLKAKLTAHLAILVAYPSTLKYLVVWIIEYVIQKNFNAINLLKLLPNEAQWFLNAKRNWWSWISHIMNDHIQEDSCRVNHLLQLINLFLTLLSNHVDVLFAVDRKCVILNNFSLPLNEHAKVLMAYSISIWRQQGTWFLWAVTINRVLESWYAT